MKRNKALTINVTEDERTAIRSVWGGAAEIRTILLEKIYEAGGVAIVLKKAKRKAARQASRSKDFEAEVAAILLERQRKRLDK